MQGWDAQLIGGIIAHNHLANPHYWLELKTVRGRFIPVDITFRQSLGCWVRRGKIGYPHIGGCDARRIKDYPGSIDSAWGQGS